MDAQEQGYFNLWIDERNALHCEIFKLELTMMEGRKDRVNEFFNTLTVHLAIFYVTLSLYVLGIAEHLSPLYQWLTILGLICAGIISILPIYHFREKKLHEIRDDWEVLPRGGAQSQPVKIPPLDPPLNIAGLSILQTAERGMNPSLLPMGVNERAERVQEAVDDPLTPGRAMTLLCRRFIEQHPLEPEDEEEDDPGEEFDLDLELGPEQAEFIRNFEREGRELEQKRLVDVKKTLEMERNSLLDEIAENITSRPGWDTPYPTTARELDRRIGGLLCASGKEGRLAELLDGMNREDLDGETLEGLAASLED